MREWRPIETRPKGKTKPYLITWVDPQDTYDDGTWGPDSIEFTHGFIEEREGYFLWWNANSGNIMHLREMPTHWALPPTLSE